MSPSPVTGRSAPIVFAIVAVLAVGCGSSGSGGKSGTGVGGNASSSPSASAPTVSCPPTMNGPGNPVAARTAISHDWSAFFNTTTPVRTRLGLLQGAANLTQALRIAAKAAKGGTQSAQVVCVSFSSPTQAPLKYDLAVNGAVVLHGADGVAVLEGGKWKVSKQTFCTLVGLINPGAPIPGCS